jgi:hypothetical protein
VFGPRSFQRIVRSEQGFIKAIRPFQEESRLLRGIKNYRVAIMEANPRSFMVPGFSDADGVGYVAQGLYMSAPLTHARHRHALFILDS